MLVHINRLTESYLLNKHLIMEVISRFEGLHDQFKTEENVEDTISKEPSTTSKLVIGLERRY